MINAQDWLNQKFPTRESREQEKDMSIYEQALTGDLDLSAFVNLQSLEVYNAQITRLNLSQNKKLVQLCIEHCSQLTTIQGLENCPVLQDISIYYCSQHLVQQLTQAQQKYQNHLTQEKAQIQKEIQLIKEVIQ